MQTISPDLVALMTPAELAAYEEDLKLQTALLSPLDYAMHVSDGRVKSYPHTELLSRHAKALVEHRLYDSGIGPAGVWTPDPEDPEDGAWCHPETGEPCHNILVISCPPQHGKSLIVTETVPAWYLTLYPHNRVIVTGYEADFAKGFGRANRDKIEQSPEFGISVAKNTRAADQWEIQDHDGGLITAGAGGGITGKRGDLIIIDDPVKNSEEALSESARRKNKNWWESTIKSRVRTNTLVMLIQTRWHEDDLAGHVEATERCYVLNLPALAFDDDPDPETGVARDPDTGELDPLGRKPGEALCPPLQTRSMLLKKQQTGDGGDEPGGMLWFSALYQGKPNIEGGGILAKPYRYYEIKSNFSGRDYYRTRDARGHHKESYVNECIYFITSDLAVSTRNQADYTVFALFAWTPWNQLLLVDLLRERMESTEHADQAEKFWNNARRLSQGTGVRFFGVESKTFGISLIQALRKRARIPIKPLEADSDKIARAIPVGMMIREDRFYLPKEAEFLEVLEKEMQIFPNGKHDDMVDCLGYAAKESTHLPLRNLEKPKSHPEQMEEARKKRKRVHPIIGRLR